MFEIFFKDGNIFEGTLILR